MSKDQEAVFDSVVHVGESHRYYRGGIGSVLAVYQQYFPAFRAVGTHRHISSLGKLLYFGKNFLRLLLLLTFQRKIRIIHIHGSYGMSVYRKSLIAFVGKSLFRKKIIYHIHSSEYIQKFREGSPRYQSLVRGLFQRADRIGCLTPKWLEQYQQEFGITRGIVMPNMISPPAYDPSTRVMHRPGTPVRFLFLGLIHEKKGIFELVDMLAKHRAEFEGRVIIHLGGIGKVDELKAAIREHQLEQILDYRGWIGEKEKSQLYREVDAFLLPSHNEGLPICILEAMSYGLPVIATRVGGIPEIMESGVNGFLIEKADQHDLYTALLAYVENPELLQQHGLASLRLIQQYYPAQVVPKLEAVYRSVLNENA